MKNPNNCDFWCISTALCLQWPWSTQKQCLDYWITHRPRFKQFSLELLSTKETILDYTKKCIQYSTTVYFFCLFFGYLVKPTLFNYLLNMGC